MAKKVFKTFFRIAEFLFGFVIILLLLLFIRLYQGPIEIKNLTPMIVDNFTSEEQDVQVSIKDAYIELALSRGRLMDIRLHELEISDTDGFILTVQDANVSFNPFWLLLGKLALRDINLERPYIQMNLASKTAEKQEKTKPLGKQLNRVRRYAERLDALKISDAQLVLTIDENASISFPNLNVQMDKNFLDEMKLNTTGDVYFDGVFSKFNLDVLYDIDTKNLEFTSLVNGLDLSKMHELSPYLKGADFILDLSAKGNLDLSLLKTGWQQVFRDIDFDIKTQNASSLYLPYPIDTTYPIDNVLIKGKILPQLTNIEIHDSQIDILGNTVKMNAFISGFPEFFKSKNINDLTLALKVSVSDIPMSEVPKLWPSNLGSSAHLWVQENVLDGHIISGGVDLDLKGSDLNNFSATLDIAGATVRYVEQMIPASNAGVRVTFEKNQIKMDVLSGKIGKINAVGGYVNFLDLDKEEPRFDMSVQFDGKISEALAVVSSEPLKVCENIQIPCSEIKGNASGNVKLAFPFLGKGLADFITFSVQADLDETEFLVPKTDWDISQGNFRLFVNNNKMTLEGNALLDDNPISLDVMRSFEVGKELTSLYRAKLPLTVSMITPYFAHIGDFFKGSLLADITVYPQTENTAMVDVDLGLKDAQISLPIGYTKEFNQDGILKATLSLKDDKLIDIPSIYLSIPDEDISIKGNVKLPDGKLFQLHLSEIKSPRTDAQMMLEMMDNAMDIQLLGKSLDVSDLLHGQFFSDDKIKSQTQMDFNIQATVDTLYLADREPFKDVRIILKKQNGHWKAMDGSLISSVPFTFALNEAKDALNIQTDDVGEFLRRAGFTDRIKGGHLNTTIVQDKSGQLKGELLVKNYELTDTGFFMQASTLLGIVEALRGDTIAFDKAVIPFSLTSANDLEISEAVASGTALGITLSGSIKNGKVDLGGSVVPAYALNSLPGKIPVIGTLLSGEEGGGLIGVSYRITGDTENPQFSFNPASLLTPGIFRRLFNAF